MLRPALFRSMNGWIVSVYKIFGFGVLVALVVGMASFLAVNVFFMFNQSWIVPVILSPNHDRVVQTNVNFMEQSFQADKLRTEKTAIEAQLAHIRHAIELHERFQANFVKALEVEERQKLAKLKRLSRLGKELGESAESLAKSSKTYRKLTQKQLEEQYSARLIAQDDFIKGKYLVSQLAATDVSQKEKYDDVMDRIRAIDTELKAQSESSQALRRKDLASERESVSIDVLMKEQQYLSAEIAKSELQSKVAPLEQQLEKLDGLLDQHDEMLARLRESPYVRAAKEPVTIAFVSYDNLPSVKVGSRVMGCYLSFILCKRTGTVKRILDGEVTARHPMTNRDVRGVMVEIELADARWAEKSALMLNRAPLLL